MADQYPARLQIRIEDTQATWCKVALKYHALVDYKGPRS